MSINKHNTRIIAVQFDYHAPETILEAVKILKKYSSEATIFAGGTDLIPKIKQRVIEPKHLVNIKKIPELCEIVELKDSVIIGACTKLRDIEKSEIIKDKIPLLHQAVSSIGSVQIRNMGTIGGNLCNASPAADSAQALIALNASAIIVGSEVERTIPINDFFIGPGKTVLSKGELLKSVVVPFQGNLRGCFVKVGRTGLDVASISIAVTVSLKNGVVDNSKIVLGSVASTPLKLDNVSNFIVGKKLTDDLIIEAAELVSKSIKPITDIRGTVEYRRETSKGLTMEALKLASERTGGIK